MGAAVESCEETQHRTSVRQGECDHGEHRPKVMPHPIAWRVARDTFVSSYDARAKGWRHLRHRTDRYTPALELRDPVEHPQKCLLDQILRILPRYPPFVAPMTKKNGVAAGKITPSDVIPLSEHPQKRLGCLRRRRN